MEKIISNNLKNQINFFAKIFKIQILNSTPIHICFGLQVIDPRKLSDYQPSPNNTFLGAISSIVRFLDTNLMTLTSAGRSAHSVPCPILSRLQFKIKIF